MKFGISILALAAAAGGVAATDEFRLYPKLRRGRGAYVLSKTALLQEAPVAAAVQQQAPATAAPQAPAQPQPPAQQPPAQQPIAQQEPAATAGAEVVVLSPDGFPTLPEVSKMLGTAQETLKGLTEQAGVLQKKAETAQQDHASKMVQQKAKFEAKLRAQELGNRALSRQNVQVAQEIAKLNKGNTDIEAHAKELNSTNMVMRKELSALRSKLGLAQDFVHQVLQSTDDSVAEDLLVLSAQRDAPRAAAPQRLAAQVQQEPAQMAQQLNQILSAPAAAAAAAAAAKVTLRNATAPVQPTGGAKAISAVATATSTEELQSDSDDDDDDNGQENAAPSLIAVGERHHLAARDPEAENAARDLIRVLQKGVAVLSVQEHEGEQKLKALFVNSYKSGSHHRAELFGKQKALNGTRASLTDLQGRLRTAETHLQTTQEHLKQNLHGLGIYLQKLAHLALAPSTEAPRLMDALPAAVAAK